MLVFKTAKVQICHARKVYFPRTAGGLPLLNTMGSLGWFINTLFKPADTLTGLHNRWNNILPKAISQKSLSMLKHRFLLICCEYSGINAILDPTTGTTPPTLINLNKTSCVNFSSAITNPLVFFFFFFKAPWSPRGDIKCQHHINNSFFPPPPPPHSFMDDNLAIPASHLSVWCFLAGRGGVVKKANSSFNLTL